MLKTFLFVLLVTSLVVTVSEAQDYETGTVLKSEMKPYSQSADVTGNQVVYFIQAGTVVYQIANHSTKTEMSAGQIFFAALIVRLFVIIRDLVRWRNQIA